uniref:Oleosin-1 n=1 Tax=Cosmarium turpinii TaxID=1302300 RepID=M4N9I7_9VIRI|nr:oleosin-1 [Cosmarium turpinii]
MSYGKYDPHSRHELQSEQSWRLKDVVFLLGTLGAAGTLATVVIGTVVIGGGALLLLGTPIFLLFSPILVPLGIIATVVGGGFLTFLVVSGSALGGIAWLWNYFTGKHPYGSETVDYTAGRVKGAADYTMEKASETIGYVEHKAADLVGMGQQKTSETAGYAQQQGQQAKQASTGA